MPMYASTPIERKRPTATAERPRYKPCVWCPDQMYLHRGRYVCRDSRGCAYVEQAEQARAQDDTPLRFWVASRTQAEKSYCVEAHAHAHGHDWSCTCPAWRLCWHIRYCATLLSCGVPSPAGASLTLRVPPDWMLDLLRTQGHAPIEGRAA